MDKDRREIQRKLRVLHHAEETGHINKTCRYFGVGRSSFYRWRVVSPRWLKASELNRWIITNHCG